MGKKTQGLTLAAVVMAAAVLLSGCSLFHKGAEKVGMDEVSFMLMVWAPSGALQANDAKAQEFTLTLHSPSPTATFFSDKPKRLAAQVPLAQLVATWAKMGLADSAPLGAVTANQGQVTERSMTGILADPKWNPTTNDLSFTLRAIAKLVQGTPTAFASPPGENTLPATFAHVTLLIDPSKYGGVEYIVTREGVISLRESYAQGGIHPVDVLPPVTYIGPDYFGQQRLGTPTPSK